MRRQRRAATATTTATARTAVALAVTLALALTACSDDTGDSADTAGPATDSAAGSTTGSATDSAPATTTTPADATSPTQPADSTTTPADPPTTSHDDSPPGRAKGSQVAREDLPGFNAQWVWDTARGAPGPRPAGPGSSRCMRASMTAIGGVVEYSTAYAQSGTPDDKAILTTAVFADEHTARMAESVLSTWLRTCAGYVRTDHAVHRVRVTDDRTVATVVGAGQQRLVSFGPVQGDPDATYFNGEGYVRDGDVVSYLVFHSVGQDYDYPVGRQPVDLGLAQAGVSLKRSR